MYSYISSYFRPNPTMDTGTFSLTDGPNPDNQSLQALGYETQTVSYNTAAKQCYACKKIFGLLTLQRYYCSHCGDAFCSTDLPHKDFVPAIGYETPVKVCEGCHVYLEQQAALARLAWRAARIQAFFDCTLTLYEQSCTDSSYDKAKRGVVFAVNAAQNLPFAYSQWLRAMKNSAWTVNVLMQHGAFTLEIFTLWPQLAETAGSLLGMTSGRGINLSATDCVGGLYYLGAEHIWKRGCDPPAEGRAHKGCQPISDSLLQEVTKYSGIGIKIVYQKTPVDIQRLLELQGYKLLFCNVQPKMSHSLEPVWLVAANTTTKTLVLSIRGTASINDVMLDLCMNIVDIPFIDEITIPDCTSYHRWQTEQTTTATTTTTPPTTATTTTTTTAAAESDPTPSQQQLDVCVDIQPPEEDTTHLTVDNNCEIGSTVSDTSSVCSHHSECSTQSMDTAKDSSTVTSQQSAGSEKKPKKTKSQATNTEAPNQTHLTHTHDPNGPCTHEGFLKGALKLLNELGLCLQVFHERGYEIVLTGHSLGASIAAILATMLYKPLDGNVKAFCFAAAPCMDVKTSLASKPYITTVVLKDDVVPRANIQNVSKLCEYLAGYKDKWRTYWNDDMKAATDRVKTVWGPRYRLKPEQLHPTFADGNSAAELLRLTGATVSNLSFKEEEKLLLEGKDVMAPLDGPDVLETVVGTETEAGTTTELTRENNNPTRRSYFESLSSWFTRSRSGSTDSKTDGEGVTANDKEKEPVCATHLQCERVDVQRVAQALYLKETDEGDETNRVDACVQAREADEDVLLVPPGTLVHLYVSCGVYNAVHMEHDHSCLSSICLSNNMATDHKGNNYMDALYALNYNRRAAEIVLPAPRWVPFDEVDVCQCCNADFTWGSTCHSEAQQSLDRRHCHHCGALVCPGCSDRRRPAPLLGIPFPVTICDRCWFKNI